MWISFKFSKKHNVYIYSNIRWIRQKNENFSRCSISLLCANFLVKSFTIISKTKQKQSTQQNSKNAPIYSNYPQSFHFKYFTQITAHFRSNINNAISYKPSLHLGNQGNENEPCYTSRAHRSVFTHRNTPEGEYFVAIVTSTRKMSSHFYTFQPNPHSTNRPLEEVDRLTNAKSIISVGSNWREIIY